MDPLEDIVKLLMFDNNFGQAEQAKPVLQTIMQNTGNALAVRLNTTIENIPPQLMYIVEEVTVKRFNRIHNEGMKSYSEQGESMTFSDKDFDEYKDDISAYLRNKKQELNSLGTAYLLNPYEVTDNEI